LRARVPRERLRMAWVGAAGVGKLRSELDAFAQDLKDAPDFARPEQPHTCPPAEQEAIDA